MPDSITDLHNMPGRKRLVQIPNSTAEAQPAEPDKPGPSTEEPKSPQQIYQKWQQARTPENRHRLMESLEPTVQSALTSFAGGDPRYRIQAYRMVGQALDSYDPQKNTQLTTHVSNHLQGLNRLVQSRKQTVHIPENRVLDSRRINDLVMQYQDDNGHEPSIAYIADKLHLSKGRVQKAMNIQAQVPEFSLLSDKGHSLVGVDPDTVQIAMDYVYHDSDEKDRKLLEWLTGYNGVRRLPKIEIAKRLKMTPAGVSYRIQQIMKRLQTGVEVEDANPNGS